MRETAQTREWSGDFGRAYTDRNFLTTEEHDALYRRDLGISRKELNQAFLGEVPKDARILEVGCNIGNQLLLLQEMGFSNLSGIELQTYAFELAKSRARGINLMQASAFDIPCEDRSFDLVFTSRVLIHIARPDLPVALREIHRCADRFVWGLEYYAPMFTDVSYRHHHNLLWKADYAQLYLQQFEDLELVREQRLRYRSSEDVDSMFLLRRK